MLLVPCDELRVKMEKHEDVTCERVCRALRKSVLSSIMIEYMLTIISCGRHECGRVCCPLAYKAKSKKKKTNDDMDILLHGQDDLHECHLTCGKLLSCGLHSCPKKDHKGACGRCLQASYDEVSRYLQGWPPVLTFLSSSATVETLSSTRPWLAARQSRVYSPVIDLRPYVDIPRHLTNVTNRQNAHLAPSSPQSLVCVGRIRRSRMSDVRRKRSRAVNHAAIFSVAAITNVKSRATNRASAKVVRRPATSQRRSANTLARQSVTLQPSARKTILVNISSLNPARAAMSSRERLAVLPSPIRPPASR